MTMIWLTMIGLVLSAAQQQPPPRDVAAQAGSAMVRGRVMSAATGQPLHRVRVTLSGAAANAPSGVTDTRGEFEITGVPTGTYTLTATRAGYLTLQYGQRRPREGGRRIEIGTGQKVGPLEMAMYRGGVLAGRVADDSGDAVPAVRVEALEVRYVRGRRVPVAARIATTNDVGEFRVSGLEPGIYQLRATSQEMWESDDGKQTFVFAPTFYPGVSRADQAQPLSLGPGQEIGDLDLRLIAGRAARLTGVVEDAAGAPVRSQMVNLDNIMRTVGGALLGAGFGGSTRTDERGAFEFPPLAPGEYTVYSGTEQERVSMPVVLGESDTQHVVLSPRRPTALAGRIVTDEDAPPPFAASLIRVNPVNADVESVFANWAAPREQAPRPDWTFRFGDMEGQFLIRADGLPDGWMLHSVLLAGRDVTDVPLMVARGGPDIEGLELVLSRSGAKLSGEIVDRDGAPAADSTVVLFTEDRARWGIASRFVRATRPDDRGRFTLAGLPPGRYFAVARDVVIEGQWEDAEFLQALIRDAVRVELQASTMQTVRLTMTTEKQ